MFKPYAEFEPSYIGIGMISTAKTKIHPDDVLNIRTCGFRGHQQAKRSSQEVHDCTSIINTTSLRDTSHFKSDCCDIIRN